MISCVVIVLEITLLARTPTAKRGAAYKPQLAEIKELRRVSSPKPLLLIRV